MIRKMLDFLILRKFDKVTTDSFFSIWAIFKGLDEECSNFRTFFVPLVIIALIIGGLFLSFLATVQGYGNENFNYYIFIGLILTIAIDYTVRKSGVKGTKNNIRHFFIMVITFMISPVLILSLLLYTVITLFKNHSKETHL